MVYLRAVQGGGRWGPGTKRRSDSTNHFSPDEHVVDERDRTWGREGTLFQPSHRAGRGKNRKVVKKEEDQWYFIKNMKTALSLGDR